MGIVGLGLAMDGVAAIHIPRRGDKEATRRKENTSAESNGDNGSGVLEGGGQWMHRSHRPESQQRRGATRRKSCRGTENQ